jgi:hypothetical protein
MKIYNYHPDTFEYIGQGEADQDPLDPTHWLIPGNSVVLPPPDSVEGKTINFNEETQTWVYRDIPPPPEDPSKSLTWSDFRSFEYPPFTNYLDAIVKGDQAQVDKYIADCLAVKAKYPKPTNE